MAAEGCESISDEDKVQIAQDFILHAPPGEFNEVVNDVRALLNNDALLRDRVASIFYVYKKDQLTPVRLNTGQFVLITEFNDLGSSRFYDPRSQVSFKYDPLRDEASEVEPVKPDSSVETWRASLENAWTEYIRNHYKEGVCSVFGKSEDGVITLVACGEDHQFQPRNFWNGRLRSIWTVSFSSKCEVAELKGILKVQVHYYEDGNVQLVTQKEIKEQLKISTSEQTAKEFIRICEEAENDYQIAISENYQCMSDTTFKALRRMLPITRAKIDWNNMVNGVRVLNELKYQ